MKVLYYYQEVASYMYRWHRTHYIEELSHYGIEFDTFNPLVYSSVEEANAELIKVAKKNKYDLFLSNTCYYKMLFVETVEEIKKIGIPTLTIAWDNLMIPFMDKVLAPHFDLVWLTSRQTERFYKKWNVKYFFAPYAANPYTFSFLEPTTINRSVCFIGTPHGSRARMINQLTEHGVKVNLYYGEKTGSSAMIEDNIHPKYMIIDPPSREIIWERMKFKEGRIMLTGSLINRMKGHIQINSNPMLQKEPGLSQDDMVRTYTCSTLALSSTSAGHTDVLNKPLKFICLRNFEIPMCGGIQLCKYDDELANYFDDGKEIVFYHDEQELLDKAKYYLYKATDDEVLGIKRAARQRSEREHTWFCRFKIAFDYLGIRP